MDTLQLLLTAFVVLGAVLIGAMAVVPAVLEATAAASRPAGG